MRLSVTNRDLPGQLLPPSTDHIDKPGVQDGDGELLKGRGDSGCSAHRGLLRGQELRGGHRVRRHAQIDPRRPGSSERCDFDSPSPLFAGPGSLSCLPSHFGELAGCFSSVAGFLVDGGEVVGVGACSAEGDGLDVVYLVGFWVSADVADAVVSGEDGDSDFVPLGVGDAESLCGGAFVLGAGPVGPAG